MPDFQYTKRQYLLMRALRAGATWEQADDAVTTAIRANPMWDQDETKTYDEWQALRVMA